MFIKYSGGVEPPAWAPVQGFSDFAQLCPISQRDPY